MATIPASLTNVLALLEEARAKLADARTGASVVDQGVIHHLLHVLGSCKVQIDALPPEYLNERDHGTVAALEARLIGHGFAIEIVPGESPSVRHDLNSAWLGQLRRLVECVDQGRLPQPIDPGTIDEIRGIVQIADGDIPPGAVKLP